ncbi:MAG: hypothetical protein K9L74_00195 [Candidatus Izimaplasma sp.]|nr:hypothetical protein [Candidatus Izimaplasma bacterium]
MKKFIIIIFLLTISLTGCGLRERILAPPDEVTIPSGSFQAVCEKEDTSYTYIYQLDGIYAFYIDNVLQDESILNGEQEQAFLHSESVINYLRAEYSESCVITEYSKSTLD